MIRHIVMFEFAKEADGRNAIENAVIAKDKLLSLPEKLPFIKRMEVGINDGDADDTNYTLCLTVDFDHMDDLRNYAIHPDHLEVAAFIGKVKIGRACVDYEI